MSYPYRKKRSQDRSKAYRYTKDGLELAGKALSVALATKRLLNVEHKYSDRSGTVNPTTTFASIMPCLMSQGTDSSSRVGDSIKVTTFQFNYYASINASATDTSIRVLVILDRQPDGGFPGLDDILADDTASINIVSPLNLDNKYRFRIMYDKVHQMSINGNRAIKGSYYHRCQIPVRYGSNLGTIADVNTNNIFVLHLSDEATNTPGMSHYTRIRYLDN